MPLPAPAPRKPVHNRTIVCEGFRRDDGLWDIEGRLTDTKAYAFANAWRTRIEPGEALHEMLVRLTVDNSLTVVAIACATENSPFAACGDVIPNFQRVVGQKIGPGWHQRMKVLLGGPRGCTHHVELIGILATVAFQTVWPILSGERPRAEVVKGKSFLIDSCHVWAEGGALATALTADPSQSMSDLSSPGDKTRPT